jgi:transcriptional regulator with XRE-family HTH domain
LRISSDLTQDELADRAGVTRSTVQRLERGDSVQLDSLIRMVRALGRVEAFELLLPDAGSSPLAELDAGPEGRRRVRRSRTGSPQDSGWRWGDE